MRWTCLNYVRSRLKEHEQHGQIVPSPVWQQSVRVGCQCGRDELLILGTGVQMASCGWRRTVSLWTLCTCSLLCLPCTRGTSWTTLALCAGTYNNINHYWVLSDSPEVRRVWFVIHTAMIDPLRNQNFKVLLGPVKVSLCKIVCTRMSSH